MARRTKKTVDYFPHQCNHGKSLFIIESKFKTDGYAAWFKLLEKLGTAENHFLDCRNETDWEYLRASIGLMYADLKEVLDTLAKLESIHPELWEKKIIWSAKFVQNIEDAYKRRNTECMNFTDLCKHLSIKCKHKYDEWGNNVDINPQSKVKESILNKNKEKYMELAADSSDEKYKTFVDFLMGNNTIKEPLDYCISLGGLVDEEKFNGLVEVAKKHETKLLDKLLNLEEKLIANNGKGYKSLSLTLNNWLKNNFDKRK